MSTTTFVNSLPLTSMRLVRPPRAVRKLATAIVALFLALPVVLLVAPWQQNVPASGRVTAVNPLDRTQIIPAPVTGRLVEVFVQEGSYVRVGDELARMADQDSGYLNRLESQVELADAEVVAARESVDRYDDQLELLNEAREDAIASANADLKAAVQKVRQAEEELTGFEADRDQKLLDFERKRNLLPDQVVSELDFQRAEAAYKSAKAKVEGAKAKVQEARENELGKGADLEKVTSEQGAKIQKTSSERLEAKQKLAAAERKSNDATTVLERQKNQTVYAEREGYIQRVHAAGTANLLSQGEPLIELVPMTEDLAVELWVRGIDAPLVEPGRKVRLQFEGWPAVQFAGWPSVAVGTFGGVVSVVDAFGNSEGNVRILVVPDPDDEPWPELPYLRQGVRANAWLLLDTVRLGYEFWRQLNAFPPTVGPGPPKSDMGTEGKDKTKKFKPAQGNGKDK